MVGECFYDLKSKKVLVNMFFFFFSLSMEKRNFKIILPFNDEGEVCIDPGEITIVFLFATDTLAFLTV
jgi:hypothetical protein